MEAFVVRGGRKLEGTMRVDGAKNAALPILAASVLTEETVVLQGVPMISDVRKMTDILTMLGCRIRRDGHTLTLDAGGLNRTEMPDALSKQIRSSIFLLGPILSRFRQATVTYPGGCEIGLRPIDLHLSGLRSLGVVIHEEGGVIHCDGGMVIYPSLEEKVHIVENAVTALHAMGYENPKLAVVAGIEKVNPKMPETTDAAALKQMNQEGKITGCTIEGPISYDIAMDPQIAKHKGFANGDCGDFDCLIMPNLVAGNILGKCYTVTVGAPMAGVIMGAKVPIIMTSRGSDENEKFYSIVMAARIAMGGNK